MKLPKAIFTPVLLHNNMVEQFIFGIFSTEMGRVFLGSAEHTIVFGIEMGIFRFHIKHAFKS